MAMASFIGKLALVPKCNQPNSGTKHHTLNSNSSIRVLVTSSPPAAAETIYKSSKKKIGKGKLWEIRASENMATETSSEVVEEKLGVKIQRNPPESKLAQLGVRNWPKWGCPPSKFPWTYSSKETCYLLKGKVKVCPDGSDETVEFGAGDLVEFPNGMSCTWDVSETVDKHYKFE